MSNTAIIYNQTNIIPQLQEAGIIPENVVRIIIMVSCDEKNKITYFLNSNKSQEVELTHDWGNNLVRKMLEENILPDNIKSIVIDTGIDMAISIRCEFLASDKITNIDFSNIEKGE